VTLDRLDDFTVAALLALHVHGNDGMQRRHQQEHMENKPQQQARDDKRYIKECRKRLPVKQQPHWGNEDRQKIDHRGSRGSRVFDLHVDTDGAGAMRASERIIALVFFMTDV
jgi:hypothetical protein